MSKLSYKTLLIIFFFLLITIVILWKFVLPKSKVEASWWNDGWNYRKAVSISNTGIAQTNTQIKILNNYDLSALVTAGKIQADLDDLRFTDINGNLLNYWIEDSTNNSVDIWGVVSSLPTSGTTIYMYYGNPSATSVSSTSNITIGGTMTSIGGYRIHTFNSNGTLTNANNTNAEVLVVASGGGGGSSQAASGGGGGGGAGGLTYNSSYSLTQGQIINVTVGIGGTNGGTGLNQSGTDGGNSIFGTVTANGGGGGGTTGVNGRPGGSGGGGGYNGYTTVRYGGSGVVGIGNSGGATTDLASAGGAGGGGVGGVGGNNITGHVGGNGGLGINYSITGIGVTYASGGRGGGGAAPVNKTANTGNGGDGAYSTSIPTSGASGIVVVRFLSGTASTPSTEEAGGGPIAYWKFDEGTGTTAYDSTANQNNGILSGTTLPTWADESQCISGKCLQFNGSTSYLNIPTNPNIHNTNLSVSLWFKLNTINPDGNVGTVLMSDYSNPNDWIFYVLSSGSICLRVHPSGSSTCSASSLISTNKWYHATFTITNNSSELIYLNGKNVANGSYANTSSSNAIKIGTASWAPGNNSVNGFIDEPKIYPYARTAAQIKLDYNSRGSSKGTSANLGSNKNNNSLSDGLIAWYTLDGDANDHSGVGLTSTVSGATVTTGRNQMAYNFDGSNDYIELGNVVNFQDFTISLWVYPSNSQVEYADIIDNYHQSSENFVFQQNSTTLNEYSFFGIPRITLTANTWTHLVIAHSSSKTDRYVNGQLSSSISNSPINYVSPSLRLGGSARYGRNWNGKMQDVRIYNRVISPNEADQLYNYAPGPIFYWDFNEGIGTTAFDKQNHTNLPISNATYTSGKYGGGLNFNGNAWLEKSISPSIAAAQDYTQCLWFNPSNSATRQVLIDDSNQWEHWIAIDTNRTIMACYYNTVQVCATSTNTVNLNTWNYVCSTYKADQSLDLFVNGVSWATNTNVTANASKIYDDVCIGKAGGGSNGKFTGKIDDVKIYNYARTQKQITEDMNANHPAVSSNSMIGYWKFDEGSGTTANNSGNGGSALNGTFGTGNSAPIWSDGKFNKALNFSTNQYLYHNSYSLENTKEISISAWVKPVSDTYIFQYGSSNSWDGYLNFFKVNSNGSMTIDIEYLETGHFTPSSSNSVVPLNIWSYVSVSVGTHYVKFYVNGLLVNTSSYFSGMFPLHNASPNYNNIGRYYYNSSTVSYSSGTIDEVKVYNYALTDDEIKQDYNQGSALQMGQTNQTIGGTTTSLEYCIPGDTSPCASPVAEWNFEENTGTTTKDSSGNNNLGTFGTGNSAPTWTVGKKNTGAGLRFDGVNDYLTFPNYFNLSPATFEFWFKANSWSNSPLIIGKDNAGATNGYIQYTTGTLKFYAPGNAVTVNFGNPSLNTWHHATLVITGTQHLAYLDGSLVGSPVSSALALFTGNYNFKVGCYDGGALAFNGSIDQMKIYNYVRTPAQVAYDYNKGGPIAWWKLDECQGNIANDSSGIGNTGVIVIGSSGTQNSLGTCQIGTSAAWTAGASGKINGSLNFDGTDDYVTKGSSINTGNNFSVFAWVKPQPAISGRNVVVSNSYPFTTDQGWLLSFQSNNAFFISIGNDNAYAQSANGVINNGVWNFIGATVTNGGASFNLYLNGKLIPNASGLQSARTISYTDNTFFIGKRNTEFFNGQIDDVRIYNYSLTPEQVKTLYNGGAVSFN